MDYKNLINVTFAGKILVKRVFRGDVAAHEILVEGLGDPAICLSRPRLGDTKIFFLKEVRRNRRPHHTLYSSILRLTLANLKILWKMEEADKGRIAARNNFFDSLV